MVRVPWPMVYRVKSGAGTTREACLLCTRRVNGNRRVQPMPHMIAVIERRFDQFDPFADNFVPIAFQVRESTISGKASPCDPPSAVEHPR